MIWKILSPSYARDSRRSYERHRSRPILRERIEFHLQTTQRLFSLSIDHTNSASQHSTQIAALCVQRPNA
jgi:hypothetical protein